MEISNKERKMPCNSASLESLWIWCLVLCVLAFGFLGSILLYIPGLPTLTMQLRLASNLCYFYLNLSNASIVDVNQHAWFAVDILLCLDLCISGRVPRKIG